MPLPDFGREPFTIVAWIKTTEGGTIFARTPREGDWAPQGKSFFVRSGRLCYDIGFVGVVESTVSVNDGKWHCVAVSGPVNYEFSVDGRPDSRGELQALADVAGHVGRVGFTCQNFPEPSGFKGRIDELRIYRRRLAPAETVQDASDAAAWWTFDGDLGDRGAQGPVLQSPKPPVFVPSPRGKSLVLDGKTAFDVVDSPADEIWNLLERDFPNSKAEISWARGDGIFDDVSTAPSYAELAKRFGAHIHLQALAKRAAALTAATSTVADLRKVRDLYILSRKVQDGAPDLNESGVSALRLAIRDLATRYGPKYPGAAAFLARLRSVETNAGDGSAVASAAEEFTRIRRDALVLSNPELSCGQLLFVKRKTYQSSHYYTDYIDGCKFYGGNIAVLDLKTGHTRDLVPKLQAGIFGRFDLSFDAKRVVFDWKAAPDKGFRIYEVGIDGKGLRQLTHDDPEEADLVRRYRTVGTPSGIPYESGTDDMQPCYLPNGDIAFISTRCRKGILCDAPDVLTTTVLYRMDRNGGSMRPLSFNSVSEAAPSISSDGRILYTRWEYVDKGASACKCIWAMNPDGSGSSEIYANNISHPTTFIDARAIPGEPNAYVVVGAPHMPLGVGSVIRLDTRRSLRTLQPMTSLTPEIWCPDESGFHHLRAGSWVFDYDGPLFCEPYPVSRKRFLVSYNPDRPWNEPTGYGIYLLDEFGNRELVHKEADYSCWEPYPLRPRPVPPVVPDLRAKSATPGTMVLQDVYAGMKGIERGRVKFLRIMEDIPRPWSERRYWDGDDNGAMQEHVAVGMDGHLAPKRTHGIVPVEADGSAYFTVPANKNVYFQALDDKYMELQRMRTFVNVRPGEIRGCVGCHEEKRFAPAGGRTLLALNRPPSTPEPQPGDVGPRAIHYTTDVQPILDRRCASCHSGESPAAGLDFSGTKTRLFSRSYENLVGRGLVGRMVNEIGPNGAGKHANVEAADPLTYGSHTSPLVKMLLAGGHGVQLTREEFVRIVTWIDANSPFYGSWDGRRNIRYAYRPDFRPDPDKPCPTQSLGPGHPFVCTDNGRNMVVIASAAGRIEWEYPAEFPQDVWSLPNGDVLFSHLHGAKEVTRDKRVVWEYRAPPGTEVHNCQPLPGGLVLVCENGTRRMMEIDRSGVVKKQFSVDCATPTVHMQFRIARKLENGNYLVAFVGEHKVRELDSTGRVVRTIDVPGDVFVAIRLPDGNTLIGCGDGHRVIEVDPHDRVVWQIDENEFPAIPLRFVAGLQRLPNGDTVVCNWGGHGWVGGQPLILEVTREKKLKWVFDDYAQFRTISNIQLLDVPGDVTKGEVLR